MMIRAITLLGCLFLTCFLLAQNQLERRLVWGKDTPPINPELKPDIPDWAADAVWYQTWIQYYRNADPSNDPTEEIIEAAWPFQKPKIWKPFPMDADPFSYQPWEEAHGESKLITAQLRRYGGDFQGFIEKLDYLKALGVTAVYILPMFEAPAYHTYDTRMYHHANRFYGPDPQGDAELYKTENPDDPSTWVWTAADKQFIELIAEAHKRDIKILVDGVFTYVGPTYWDQSYHREGKDPPTTPEYKAHIQAVVERWGDPNGDGDPSDGLDGWRLDIGLALPHDFIREFRSWMKSVNPEALLVAESWWDGTHFINTSPWLQGDMYDSHMNYMFGEAMIRAFVDDEKRLDPWELDVMLEELRLAYPAETHYGLWNLIGTHDVGRFAGMLLSPDAPHWQYKYHMNCGMPYSYQVQQTHRYEKDRHVGGYPDTGLREDQDRPRPTTFDRQIQKSILTFMYCYIGTPFIYMGDENGTWYGTRTPKVWDDLDFDVRHPFGKEHPVKPNVDSEILEFYQALGKLRAQEKCLRRGNYRTVFMDDAKDLFAFQRAVSNGERIAAVFNLSKEPQVVDANSLSRFLQPSSSNVAEGEIPLDWELIFGDPGDLNVIPAKGSRVYKYRLN